MLLLHGWLASAGLNWIQSFDALSRRYAVFAPDLHGHAGASSADVPIDEHSQHPFEIERCADDMAALIDHVSPGCPMIVIGYSLGGMVAQSLWRRHPDRVAGLVLGATSAAPVPRSRGRRSFSAILSLARRATTVVESVTHTPRQLARTLSSILPRVLPPRIQAALEATPLGLWAACELAGHHWPTVLDAGRAIAEFDTRDWIGEVDVPTSILLTKRDSLIPAAQQHAMAAAIGHAHVETIDAGHFACVRDDFADALLASCRAVERALV